MSKYIFPEKKQGQTWTYKGQEYITTQIDYIIINKKFKNNAYNCRAYRFCKFRL